MTTQVPSSGPGFYHQSCFYQNGFVYSFGPYNLPAFDILSINGNLGIAKYKVTPQGPIYVGTVGLTQVSVADFGINDETGIQVYNNRVYINVSFGATSPGVYIIEIADLESNKQVIIPRVQQLPIPAANALAIGPDGAVYCLGAPTLDVSTIDQCYLLVTTIQSNGLMGKFVKTNIPAGIYSWVRANGTAFPNIVLTLPGGFLSVTKNFIVNNTTVYAIKIDPVSGKWYEYTAPNWKKLVATTTSSLMPYCYYGPIGKFTLGAGGNQPLFMQFDNNDLLSSNVVYVPSANTTLPFFTTETTAYASDLLPDYSANGPVTITPIPGT